MWRTCQSIHVSEISSKIRLILLLEVYVWSW